MKFCLAIIDHLDMFGAPAPKKRPNETQTGPAGDQASQMASLNEPQQHVTRNIPSFFPAACGLTLDTEFNI